MKTISILGCGWSGLAFAKQAIDLGFKVKGSTSSDKGIKRMQDNGIIPFVLNIGEIDKIEADFFHCDILVILMSPDPLRLKEKVYQLHEELAIKVASTGISQVILASATSVYKNEGIATETDAVEQVSPHSGISMLRMENAWRKHLEKELVVLRFAGLFGPDRAPGKYFVGRKIAGADDQLNMVHLDDVCGVIDTVIQKNVKGETYNVCSPIHPTRRTFYTKAFEKQGLGNPFFDEDNTRTGYRIVNCDKITSKLNYTFKHPNPVDAL